MKSFVISILTLAIICGVIIWNYVYINKIYDYMNETVNALECNEVSAIKVDELWSFWKKKSIVIAISIPHRVSDDLERNLVILRTKLKEGSNYEFEESKSLVLNSIEEMRIHAGASLDSIF
ncbi:MAG: hypothetical protein IJW19_01535 [Clostridia bacterium]|nr:hypothetical protein [Clostridia bacterium]